MLRDGSYEMDPMKWILREGPYDMISEPSQSVERTNKQKKTIISDDTLISSFVSNSLQPLGFKYLMDHDALAINFSLQGTKKSLLATW